MVERETESEIEERPRERRKVSPMVKDRASSPQYIEQIEKLSTNNAHASKRARAND